VTAHFDRNISFVTSLTQTNLKIFISSPKILLLFLVVDQSINQSIKIHIAPLPDPYSEALLTQGKRKDTAIFHIFSTFPPRRPLFITAKTPFHHIFVHHCTFCASLHVKTCHDWNY